MNMNNRVTAQLLGARLMDFVVVTNCTNRKRLCSDVGLQARLLDRSSLEEVAGQWTKRIRAIPGHTTGSDLYCGRGFQEAVKTSSSGDTPMFIISAGLGLLPADQLLPAYSLTLTNGSPDSIRSKVIKPILPHDWWEAMTSARDLQAPLAGLVQNFSDQRVLVACSEIYAQMISKDIETLQETDRKRVRILGPRNPSRLPCALRSLVMPYDERFDGVEGPYRGTRSDFPQRTLRHFAESIIPQSPIMDSPEQDAALVMEAHEIWTYPVIPKRRQMSDEQILEMIPNLWERARGGSVRMLRVLRDEEQIACEQRRFGILFKQAKERYAL